MWLSGHMLFKYMDRQTDRYTDRQTDNKTTEYTSSFWQNDKLFISLVNEEITGRAIHRTFARVIAYLTH